MDDLQKVVRNLWIIIGVTAFPFVILALSDTAGFFNTNLYLLMVFSGLFNGLIIPFYLMSGSANWFKKTLAIGTNIIIAGLWVSFTGSVESIFYPNFFFIPIVAATIYGGFISAVLTALLSALIAFAMRYQHEGFASGLWHDQRLLVSVVLFFLVASVVGYLIKIQREQYYRNQRMTEELEVAYNQLSSSHEQLQSYTGIIEKMNKEMEQLAITDELTMLYNYRYFQITLDKEIKRNRYSHLTLIMLDIDYFKKYNDQYGHTMGNRILQEIATIMRDNVREVDTVVRYGGEEFAVVLPSTDTEEAFHVAERIRRMVQSFVFNTPDGAASSVTVSMGIACFPKDATNKSELISHADLALYKAKTGGRNRVCIYDRNN